MPGGESVGESQLLRWGSTVSVAGSSRSVELVKGVEEGLVRVGLRLEGLVRSQFSWDGIGDIDMWGEDHGKVLCDWTWLELSRSP